MLSNPDAFVIESPVDSPHYLDEVGFCSYPQAVNNSPESVQNHSIIGCLFMKGSECAVHQLVSEGLGSVADVAPILATDYFFDSLHDHLSICFILIFETFEYFFHYFDDTNFVGNLYCCLDKLFVIPFFQGHSSDPEIVKKLLEYIFSNVASLYSIAPNNLLQYFQDDFAKLFFISPELLDY